MKHTFLLEEGEWLVKGSYFDAEGKKSPVTGTTTVQHGEESWVSDGTLTMGETRALPSPTTTTSPPWATGRTSRRGRAQTPPRAR